MVVQRQLKVLALGTRMMLQRLKALLNGDEMQIAGISDSAQAFEMLQNDHFDMVIVDSLLPDSNDLCRNINNCSSRLPLALMLPGSLADWKQFHDHEVDGFLPESAGKSEMLARIKAVSRRKNISAAPLNI